MDLVDSKYIGLVSSRLKKFKRVKGDLYNFRCPLCGDSKKHKNKARGYIYPLKSDMNYKCHNCGASSTFSNFLKQIDTTLHNMMEMLKLMPSGVKDSLTVGYKHESDGIHIYGIHNDKTGELSERLILNHLIVIFNVFDIKPSLKMLEYHIDNRYWYIFFYFPILYLIVRDVFKYFEFHNKIKKRFDRG